MWQHLFWVFGHPDVYIIVLPAFGFVSEIIQTFSRRPLVAYNLIAMSTVLTGIIGFGVWAHHMFATGISPLSASFFAAASVIIALPAGVQVFAWIATILSGKPNFKTPLLFAAGFIVLFVMGGVTGVMFPVIAFDRQVTDTYFVVAHFHYVLVGGMVFPLFGAFYYWFPKMTGKVLNDTLGKWNFWLMFIGFNVAFFVQHLLGLLGMPRRIYTYLPEMGWGNLNLISTLGAYTIAAGVVLFIVNVYWSLTKRGDAGDNPWNGATLEWASSSPPPPYNFRTIPPVTSMAPLWERHNVEAEAQRADTAQVDPTDPFLRETIGTTLLEARPEEIIRIPPESAAPFFVAGAMFVFLPEHFCSCGGFRASARRGCSSFRCGGCGRTRASSGPRSKTAVKTGLKIRGCEGEQYEQPNRAAGPSSQPVCRRHPRVAARPAASFRQPGDEPLGDRPTHPDRGRIFCLSLVRLLFLALE